MGQRSAFSIHGIWTAAGFLFWRRPVLRFGLGNIWKFFPIGWGCMAAAAFVLVYLRVLRYRRPINGWRKRSWRAGVKPGQTLRSLWFCRRAPRSWSWLRLTGMVAATVDLSFRVVAGWSLELSYIGMGRGEFCRY